MMINEGDLRKIIKEEIEALLEEKTPAQKRLDDARLCIISLTTASNLLRNIGSRNQKAKEMSLDIEAIVSQVRDEIIPSLEGEASAAPLSPARMASDWLR